MDKVNESLYRPITLNETWTSKAEKKTLKNTGTIRVYSSSSTGSVSVQAELWVVGWFYVQIDAVTPDNDDSLSNEYLSKPVGLFLKALHATIVQTEDSTALTISRWFGIDSNTHYYQMQECIQLFQAYWT